MLPVVFQLEGGADTPTFCSLFPSQGALGRTSGRQTLPCRGGMRGGEKNRKERQQSRPRPGPVRNHTDLMNSGDAFNLVSSLSRPEIPTQNTGCRLNRFQVHSSGTKHTHPVVQLSPPRVPGRFRHPKLKLCPHPPLPRLRQPPFSFLPLRISLLPGPHVRGVSSICPVGPGSCHSASRPRASSTLEHGSERHSF